MKTFSAMLCRCKFDAQQMRLEGPSHLVPGFWPLRESAGRIGSVRELECSLWRQLRCTPCP